MTTPKERILGAQIARAVKAEDECVALRARLADMLAADAQQVAVPQEWIEALAKELCLWDQENPDYVLDCTPTGDKLMWHRQETKASKLIAAMLAAAPHHRQAGDVVPARCAHHLDRPDTRRR